MKRSIKISLPLLMFLSLGATSIPTKWEPAPMDEVRRIYDSKSLSDEKIVEGLILVLDGRITMARNFPGQGRPTPGYEYANLLQLIAERPYPAKPVGRPGAIHTVMTTLASKNALQNPAEVNSLLNIALGLAGEAHDAELLAFLENQNTASEITFITLSAMENSHVPMRALPRLLTLAGDSMNFVDPSRLGHPKPERIFPMRDKVFSCLKNLGVKSTLVHVDDKPDHWGRKFSTTVVEIDRPALISKLRESIRSKDLKTKSEALEISQKIGDDDVKSMLHEESLRKP